MSVPVRKGMAQQTTTEARTADKYTAAVSADGLASELERETDLYELAEGSEVTLVYDSAYTNTAETEFTGTVVATGTSHSGALTTFTVEGQDSTKCLNGFGDVENDEGRTLGDLVRIEAERPQEITETLEDAVDEQANEDTNDDDGQPTICTDGGTEQADPELAANTLAQAADSLQVHCTRSEMRSAAREWDTRKSGTKQEMAEDMLADAQEQALALLVEEGVELGGDLTEGEQADEQETEQAQAAAQEQVPDLAAPEDVPAEVMDEVAREYGMGAGAVKGSLAFMNEASAVVESEADEAAIEARERAAQAAQADEQADEGDGSTEAETTEQGSENSAQETDENGAALAGALLYRDRDAETDHGTMRLTDKQQRVIEAAKEDPQRTQAEVAAAADASERYTNRTLNRYDADEHEQ